MAESKQDRIDVQIEKIHTIETLMSLKPDITLEEYLEIEKKLLTKLKRER